MIPNKTQSVKSLDRGLALLELLANSKKSLSLLDLVQQTDFPKSSLHSLLVTLQRHDYIQKSGRCGSYMFGLKLLGLAGLAVDGLKLQHDAAPCLGGLMRTTRLTVHLAILERNEAVLVAKAEPATVFPLATWVGMRLSLHCTALGKALMAHLPRPELEELRKYRRLPRHNDNTIYSWKRLDLELERTLRQGYAIDDEENELDLRCVGAPVFGRDGRVIAAVSVSGKTVQISPESVCTLAALVKRTAASISGAFAKIPVPQESPWLASLPSPEGEEEIASECPVV